MFCELFGYKKQAYYKQIKNKADRSLLHVQVKASVQLIRRKMPRLGTRKLHFLLKDEIGIGRDTLFLLLRQECLLITRRIKPTITTNSKHWMHKFPNQIIDLILIRPEQVWVSDITYIDTLEGHMYLHLVTDAYSKRIMGFELCSNMEAASTLKALMMALSNRQYPLQA